jgi:DNA-binding NtrC family response regulator
MTERLPSILLVEDDESLRATLARGLRHRFEVLAVDGSQAALDLMANREVQAVLTDLRLSGMDGIELCKRTSEMVPGLPVVLMTGFGNLETAVAAIRAGAYDFVSKPVDLELVELTLDRAVRLTSLSAELRLLKLERAASARSNSVVGESPAMRDVLQTIDRIGDSDVTVLVTGESGTGKEVIAREIHHHSRRREAQFVALSCAALPEHLLESELFGHEKGAFTDARGARLGLLREASGGTLFLDEVGELPLSLQPKLLRALQERAVRPIGGSREVPFDARIVAATNRNLEGAIDAGSFRPDLYYRLAVFELELPPLRSRANDVLLLASKFIERFAQRSGKDVVGLSPEAANLLLHYSFPGNVRELENAMERAVALARFDRLTPDDLPARMRESDSGQSRPNPWSLDSLLPLDEVERQYIQRVLDAVGGHRAQAARILGIDRKTLFRKLSRTSRSIGA